MDTATPGPIVRAALALAAVFTLIGVSLWIVLPFIGAAVWGGIIAISSYRMHQRLTVALGGKVGCSALLISSSLGLLLMAPLVMAFLALGEHAGRLLQEVPRFQEITIPPPPEWLEKIPLLATRLLRLWQKARADLVGTLESVRPQLLEVLQWILSRLVASAVTIIEAVLAIAFAAGFLIHGPRLASFFERLFTMLGAHDNAGALLGVIQRTVRAVTRGVIAIAVFEGFMAWIGFELAGAPFPVVLACIVVVLSAIQLGMPIIGVPLAIWMWMSGDIAGATIIALWTVLVKVLESVAKPLVIGQEFPVPIWVAFLGVIGGLMAMGVIGLFIGPVILSVAYQLLVGWVKLETAAPKDA